ncbi:MAG: NAD(+) synthase, partial [Pseudomonadales bacterium]
GKRTGIVICEDLWNDKGSDDYNYADNPMEQYRNAGVDVLLSLNSSPWIHGKDWQRLKTIGPGTEPDLTVIYVNQRGGQDELVFDGQSFVMRGGNLIHRATGVYEDSFDVVDIDAEPTLRDVYESGNAPEIRRTGAQLYDLLVLCLRDYVHKSGFEHLVLASSGGVDSAVVCKLACDAVGPGNVHAIRMPSIFSSDHSETDSKALHANLGCWDYEVPIDHESTVGMLREKYGRYAGDSANLAAAKLAGNEYNTIADENIQARLRDVFVMHFSNAFGAMALSTGNKTESACGYYTHFDMNFGFAPIKDLYKFQVADIARACMEIPEHIWQKPPSAELAEGQTDEASLLPYAVLDPIVRAYVEEYISTFDRFAQWVSKALSGTEKITSDPEFLA